MQRQLAALQQNTSARSSTIDLVDKHRNEKADRPANHFIAPPFAFQASPVDDSYLNYCSRLLEFQPLIMTPVQQCCGAAVLYNIIQTLVSTIIVGPLSVERSLRGIWHFLSFIPRKKCGEHRPNPPGGFVYTWSKSLVRRLAALYVYIKRTSQDWNAAFLKISLSLQRRRCQAWCIIESANIATVKVKILYS